jgi:hypothetical protein
MKQSSVRIIAGVVVLAVIIVAVAAIYATTASNSANNTTNKPDHIDWVGAVCDVNHMSLENGGVGAVYDANDTYLENVTVTLCLMTPTGEAYNMTNRTLAGIPYPGSYTFLDVPVRDDVTYAYAYAVSDGTGDSGQLFGRTNDILINQSRIMSGLIVMHAPGANISDPYGNGSGSASYSWFGTVIDNDSRPLGGIAVTLHLMTPDGEAATYTTTSISDGPYPGSFVFDNVLKADNLTYGYVTAESRDPGDGTLHTAQSDNHTFDRSRISSGILVL